MIISNLETDATAWIVIPRVYLELACDMQAALIQLLSHIWNRAKVFRFHSRSKCGKNYPLRDPVILLRVRKTFFIKSLDQKKNNNKYFL